MINHFKNVLAEFESYGGTGIVFGGCLRDTLVGVGPIKDIDVAVKATPENKAAIQAFQRAQISTVAQQFFGYDTFPDVVGGTTVDRGLGSPSVNFVILSADHPFTLKDVADRCDFGICQVAMGGDGAIYKSPAFREDFYGYTFTYLRHPFDQMQLDRSLRRFERLSADKYEGWRLRVPGRPYMDTPEPKIVGRSAPIMIVDEVGQLQQFQNVPGE